MTSKIDYDAKTRTKNGGFKAKIGHVDRVSVGNGSPPLRCFFGAVLPGRITAEMNAATRYTLWRNSASIMKISF